MDTKLEKVKRWDKMQYYAGYRNSTFKCRKMPTVPR